MSSPRIEHISWGKMKVQGIGEGKDFKLWPGGGREWDWTETGTRHRPGIQPADIIELLQHGAGVIVLSKGMLLQLHTCKSTLELIGQEKLDVHIAETKKAVKIYNDLAETGMAVAGLFHSTC